MSVSCERWKVGLEARVLTLGQVSPRSEALYESHHKDLRRYGDGVEEFLKDILNPSSIGLCRSYLDEYL